MKEGRETEREYVFCFLSFVFLKSVSYVPSEAPRVTASAPPTARNKNMAVPQNSPMAGIYHRCKFETMGCGVDMIQVRRSQET